MKLNWNYVLTSIACCLLITLPACGGGSEGTGSGNFSRTIEGVVQLPDSSPVANASITLSSTGESAVTDDSGRFSIETSDTDSSVTLDIQSSGLDGSVTLPAVENEATSLSVTITVDQQNQNISISNVNMWARVVGACDIFFENFATIRQSNAVSEPIQCVMKFFVSGDGHRLSDIPGVIQVRSCDSTIWRTIATGETGVGLMSGIGQIPFTFIDNEANCEYRIVAPFDVPNLTPLAIYISTQTLQGRN